MSETYTAVEEVEIPASRAAKLRGQFGRPQNALGTVVFAHGSGSSRLSRRNQRVAAVLQHAGFATLLFDLLTPEEEASERETRHLRFDIDLLAERLSVVRRWIGDREDRPPTLGYFGASTGAAAALVAAAGDRSVAAVVSRGGRPDLAGDALEQVRAPTLLIVGSADPQVFDLNLRAQQRLASAELEIVPGAGHLFEEPGALDEVARLASRWFSKHMGALPA